MKIAIIGGGAIGLLFAHYLSKEHEVTLYVHQQGQADLIAREGLILEKDNQYTQITQKSQLFHEWKGEEDLTIMAVKQYHLPELMPLLLKGQNDSHSFLFLQNGMGHLKLLHQLTAGLVFVGTVEHGSLKKAGNHIAHTGIGMTKIAAFSGEKVCELAHNDISDFPFEWHTNYKAMLAEKLLVNAVINPLTAVFQVKNGEIIRNSYYLQIFTMLYQEVSAILQVADKEKGFLHVQNICKKTAANFSSMYKDLEQGRKTEVDAILGYLLEEAREQQFEAQLTALFYYSIKAKELEQINRNGL
ncbi:2-dehydropantoate 2-reductase [Cytobacillus gottheilii]|uniref:2-dehydropantoate 2-reductase n=1 Tax=Cytobacillus gottheilii TaxID=859144 RepID=UPI0009BB9B17|nr:2-dehydropantoate 2-reductase [Cytobacillus gottheilii]